MAGQRFAPVKILDSGEDITRHYTVHGLIGRGAFGHTLKASPINEQNKIFCLKIQPKNSDNRSGSSNSGGTNSSMEELSNASSPDFELMRLYREVLILNRILPRHPNIVEMIDVLVSPEQVFIVTELCAESMNNFIPLCDENSARRAFGQLIEAVDVCHQHGVTHDDIKEDNILFLDSQFIQLKLIDFGIAEYRPEHAVKRHNDFNPADWFSPEEILPTRNPNILDDDMASVGMLLLAMMCGKPIPDVVTVDQMQTKYRPRTNLFSPAAIHLLTQIGPKPYGPEDKRDVLKLDQIRQHPWLTGQEFHPPVRNAGELLAQLPNDLTVIKRLLRDWMVTPVQILAQNQAMEYNVVDQLHRGNQQTEIQLVAGRDSAKPMAMKVVQVSDDKPPVRIYLDMLITMRILPPHDNFGKIKDIYVNQQSVSLIKTLYHTNTLEEFFPVANDVSSRRIFKEIAEAVCHMHHHGVVHMNLHPSHFVFTTGNFNHVKIVNCSKAVYVPQLAHFRYENFEPEQFLTPEILEHMATQADFQEDISALGKILHAMMNKRWDHDLTMMGNGDLGAGFTADAFDLLSKIGPESHGPPQQDRNITIEAICDHQWLHMARA
ncbi:hypothetical protein R1flu_010264 [Riccia fluitans]|uniref:Protein kinase domain-containing protein n=1 Tax=Riccia fluitans TaxID=41844 RepID=A0ABD1Z8Q1_9MARC